MVNILIRGAPIIGQ